MQSENKKKTRQIQKDKDKLTDYITFCMTIELPLFTIDWHGGYS